jgi:hypothetical protein
MNAPIVAVTDRSGLIFEGEIPETYCFVPRECISVDAAGAHLDEISYVQSGWDVRNMRLSDTTDGEHLFPNTDHKVVDFESAAIKQFLERMRIFRVPPDSLSA